MKILRARVRWYEEFDNVPIFEILVDSIPKHKDLVYTKTKSKDCAFYFAEEAGYVNFSFANPRNQEGYGGTVFKYKLQDGSTDIVKGPWSSSPSAIYDFLGITTVDVSITADPEVFERGYTFFAGNITLEKAIEAAKLVPNIYFLKLNFNNLSSSVSCKMAGTDQLSIIGGYGSEIKYVPSLSSEKPVKYRRRYGSHEPNAKKAMFTDKLYVVERLT